MVNISMQVTLQRERGIDILLTHYRAKSVINIGNYLRKVAIFEIQTQAIFLCLAKI